MKLEEVLPALREGKRIKRAGQEPIGLLTIGEGMIAEDWEVVKDPVRRYMRCTLSYMREHFGHFADSTGNSMGIPSDTPPETRFKITVEEIVKD